MAVTGKWSRATLSQLPGGLLVMRQFAAPVTFWFLIVSIAPQVSAMDLVIAGYGDSLTGDTNSKWCGHVQAPDACDPTHAIPGERTQDGSARLIADLAVGAVDANTTHIALAWGANDIRRSDLDWNADFEQPLRDAVNAVLEAGFKPVLVVTLDQYKVTPTQSPIECDPFPDLQARLDAEFSPRIYDISNDYSPPLAVVDLNAAYDAIPESVKCPGAWHSGYYADHVHQTDAGYQFMADAVVADIRLGPGPSVPSLSPLGIALLWGLLGVVGLQRLRA